jgi:hypothetical protein
MGDMYDYNVSILILNEESVMWTAQKLLNQMEPLFLAIADPEVRTASDDAHVIAKAVASSIAVVGAAILNAMEDYSHNITHDLENLGELLDESLVKIQKTVDRGHLESTSNTIED